MIRAALGTFETPFETRYFVPYMYYVAHCHNCGLTIFWGKIPVNQKPLKCYP